MNSQNKPEVSVIMGSDSDMPIMKCAEDILKEFGICSEVKILSAHRSPEMTREFAVSAGKRGIKVIIAGAGGAAHLAGVVAANTILPVIGVPIPSSELKGMDSLLSTVQMPSGIPVAAMSIGKAGAKNAALFAVQILACENESLAEKLDKYKKKLEESVKLKQMKIDSGK